VTDEEEWDIFKNDIKNHPDENDLLSAKAFAKKVLLKYG